MGTITPRRRADGSTGYTAQFQLKHQGNIVHSVVQTDMILFLVLAQHGGAQIPIERYASQFRMTAKKGECSGAASGIAGAVLSETLAGSKTRQPWQTTPVRCVRRPGPS